MQYFDRLSPPEFCTIQHSNQTAVLGTIIFIHGFSSSYYLHQQFVKKAPCVRDAYDYFAFNLPDHEFQTTNKKQKLNGGDRFMVYLKDAESKIRNHLAQKRTGGFPPHNLILIGHSMGGGIVAMLAHHLAKDYKIQAVVLVSPINHALYQCRVGVRYLLGTFLQKANIVYQIEFADYPHCAYIDYEVERYVFLRHRFLPIGGQLTNLHLLGKLRTAYQTLTVPTLVILGERDQVIPAVPSQRFFEHLQNPNLEIHVIPGSGHVPFVDNLVRYIKLVQAFLTTGQGTPEDTR